jgi:hypothetical protein
MNFNLNQAKCIICIYRLQGRRASMPELRPSSWWQRAIPFISTTHILKIKIFQQKKTFLWLSKNCKSNINQLKFFIFYIEVFECLVNLKELLLTKKSLAYNLKMCFSINQRKCNKLQAIFLLVLHIK